MTRTLEPWARIIVIDHGGRSSGCVGGEDRPEHREHPRGACVLDAIHRELDGTVADGLATDLGMDAGIQCLDKEGGERVDGGISSPA